MTSSSSFLAGLPGSLRLNRCLVIGVVNATPDSFSDGGRYATQDLAVEHACAMMAAGADLIDVGGESTRPGAAPVPVDEEQRRVLPVVRLLAARGIPVSIDTMNAVTAAAAVDVGALLVNDVSGGTGDPAILSFLAGQKVPCILMHWRSAGARNHDIPPYGDVVAAVQTELQSVLSAAERAGIDPERIAVDPGLGFGKDAGDNWSLLARLAELREVGRPIVVGASRKRFLGRLFDSGVPADSEQIRDAATAAITALVAAAGAWAVRVHEPAGSAAAVRVAAEVLTARGSPLATHRAAEGIPA